MKTETFEDRLLAKLTELDAARPATAIEPPARRPMLRRPAVLATTAATAVLVVASVIGLDPAGRSSGPTSVAVKPASFSVVENADGSVTFTVHDLLDLTGATKALNDAGIAGRILTSTSDCTTGPNVVPINPDLRGPGHGTVPGVAAAAPPQHGTVTPRSSNPSQSLSSNRSPYHSVSMEPRQSGQVMCTRFSPQSTTVILSCQSTSKMSGSGAISRSIAAIRSPAVCDGCHLGSSG